MKYTNKHNLPETIVRAVGSPRPIVKGTFTGSELSGPPLIRCLKEQHWDALEQDVSDMFWLLFGAAFHTVMESSAPKDSLAEERLSMPWNNGYTISGMADLWRASKLVDYKTTSVYAFLLGDKEEWTKQLNIYRMLYEHHTFPVTGMEIHAILRDWNAGKALAGGDYPQIPFLVKPVPKVDVVPVVNDWIARYESRDPCTPDEKWERPTTYAVMKDGRKTALRVLGSEDEAKEWAANNVKGEHRIDVRKGIAARCEGYCLVRDFCPNRKVA